MFSWIMLQVSHQFLWHRYATYVFMEQECTNFNGTSIPPIFTAQVHNFYLFYFFFIYIFSFRTKLDYPFCQNKSHLIHYYAHLIFLNH